MVANLSNYRPPNKSSRFNGTFSRIESLRRLLLRRTEAAFLARGYDQSFCQEITDEAMLAIHADIDECKQGDFREWAVRIAIRIGFEEIRKLHVIEARLLKAKHKSEADDCPPSQHSEQQQALFDVYELNLSPDFQRMFISEAVRKLNLLRRHLRTEFEVPSRVR